MVTLSPQEQRTLRDLGDEVRERFGDRLVALFLFGSRARGEGRGDSDIDVLVKVRELTRDERRAVQDLAFDLGLRDGLVLSPLVVDEAQWRADSTLAQAIAREGILL